jgi:hypothetical protein
MIHHCSNCDSAFNTKRKDKIYCSFSCKQMAYVKRQSNNSTIGSLIPKRQYAHYSEPRIETSIKQTVNPSIKLSAEELMQINQLKAELKAFMDDIIQEKLTPYYSGQNVNINPNNPTQKNGKANNSIGEMTNKNTDLSYLDNDTESENRFTLNENRDDYFYSDDQELEHKHELGINNKPIQTNYSHNEAPTTKNIHAINRHHSQSESATGQVVNLSTIQLDDLQMKLLKAELAAIAELAVRDKLNTFIQNVNTDTMQYVNGTNSIKDDKQKVNIGSASIDGLKSENKPLGVEKTIDKPIKKNETTALKNSQLQTQKLEPSISQHNHISNAEIDGSQKERIYAPITCKCIDKIHKEYETRQRYYIFEDPPINFAMKMPEVEWVSTHYLCLLDSILTLSNIKTVAWDDMAELSNAFAFLTNCQHFKVLPHNYPFRKDIIALREKIKNFCLQSQNEEFVEFKLRSDTKKDILLQRLELPFEKMTFNELQRSFIYEHKMRMGTLKGDSEKK